MKDYKIILISFVLIFFLIGAVSAADDSSDEAVGAQILPFIPIDPGDDGGDDPIDVEVTTKDVYVDSTGDDSNVGTKESPYATVSKAVSEVNASNDATIHIAEGTYLLEAKVTHYIEDYGDGDIDEWDEYDNLFIDLNHKLYGGNLKIIGAGADKTFLDGQSAFYFASIGINSNVTIKDVTFINCKNANDGGVIFNSGNLTVDNCVFKDSYTTSSQGGAICSKGSQSLEFVNGQIQIVTISPTIKIINSQFISTYASSQGGAIFSALSNLYLENNTFVNTRITQSGGRGAAAYIEMSPCTLIGNKFINLTGTQDASMYVLQQNEESVIVGNEFINCSNPSDKYSIVQLWQGNFKFENNTFVNSTNSVGNIYAGYSTLSVMNFAMDYDVYNVSNYEISKGFKLNKINITDDMGNIISKSSINVNLNNDENSISRSVSLSNGECTFTFASVPKEGIYNLTLSSGEATSDVLGIVNVTLNNDPVELWVSPEGLDANNGTSDSPFATIQHAIDTGFEKSFTVIIHLLKGTYTKDGNVELTIANQGSLQILGEKYNETIIDGEGTSWFLKVSTTNVNITNLKFINGNTNSARDLINGGNKLYLENCIIDSNPFRQSNYYTLTYTKFDKLVYTNNYNRVYVSSKFNITNSYFANNKGPTDNGILIIGASGVTISDSKFINNSGSQSGGAISGYFTSINNYYENNSPMISGGAVYITRDSTFINDTFVNNHARDYGGAFFVNINYDDLSSSPKVTFDNCKFINNSASKGGGVGYLNIGKFIDCSFINNTADYGGAFYLVPYIKVAETPSGEEDDPSVIPIDDDPIVIIDDDPIVIIDDDPIVIDDDPIVIDDDPIVIIDEVLGAQIIPIIDPIPIDDVPVIPIDDEDDEEESATINSLKLIGCTFENNVARVNGHDVYLELPTNWWIDEDEIEPAYGIPLTITFNSQNVTSLVDDLTATVYGPCDAVIGAKYLTFELNGTKIGSPEVKNSVVTFNYAGFEEGDYILNGTMAYPNNKNIVNSGLISVKLENIVDHIEMWVSVTGSDENGNGSESNPFKSISKAMKETIKNCRDIVIHVGEGTYTGDLNTALTISSLSNITLAGAGIDKTIIDGENASTFAKITEGNNKVTLKDLTIQNMGAVNVEEFMAGNKNINQLRDKLNPQDCPITVDEGANLDLDGVRITSCRGGSAIIRNNGVLNVENSVFNNNGISLYGIIYGGNVSIDNTEISSNVAASGIFCGINSFIVNNSVIKDNFNLGAFLLISSETYFGSPNEFTIIENTVISNDGDNSSLSVIGYDGTHSGLSPALVLAGNVLANNISMINSYNSPLTEYNLGYGDGSILSAFGYFYGGGSKNITATNSTFINLTNLWSVNTYGQVLISLDGCVFENITMIAQSQTPGEGSQYNITNSVFIDTGLVIDRFSRSDREDPDCTFENNYWGSNDKPVVTYINPGRADSFEPKTWITLYSEDEKTVIKNVTDGENSTEYTGIAPIRTDYADNNGALDYAVVFGPVGYLFTTDDETNVIFDPEDAMYPFEAADPMNYRTPSYIIIEKINGSGAIFGGLSDMVGTPIANATILYNVSDVQYNTTTDADGKFVALGGNGLITLVFEGDDYYFDALNNITLENVAPVKTQTSIDLKVDGNLAIEGILKDVNGNPLANTLITYVINGTEANVTTDDKGVFAIQGANNETVEITYVGDDSYLATSTALTLENIATTRIATVIESDYTFTRQANDYSAGERGDFFYATLKDINGNPIANVTCYVAVNGPIYNVTTDENGKFGVQVNLAAANTYTYALSFLGNEKYEASLNCSKLVLTAKKTTITAKAKAFKAKAKTKTISVTLSTVKNPYDGKTYLKAGKKLTMKLNGKTYTAKINAKGVAKFTIKLTKKGKYTAKITFAGDKTYKASSKSIKVTIK